MIFFFLLLIIGVLYKIEYRPFNEQYLSKDSTNAIKGLFVMIVFLKHAMSYIQMDNPADMLYVSVSRFLGQLIVCMFLFYSGYGVLESIKIKKDYMKTFLKHRLFKTWLHFAIAIIGFLIVDYFLGFKFQTRTYILAFTGWESVQNSNWFVFCILYMYVATYLSFRIVKSTRVAWCLMVFATVFYILVLHHYKEYWWWDTVVCYPLGMLYSIYKDDVEKVIKSSLHGVRYVLVLGLGLLLFVTTYMEKGVYVSCLKAIFFTLLVVVLTVKLNVRSKIFIYFGVNTFGIFILQRIPMLIFREKFPEMNKYLFVILCFIITLVLSEMFNVITRITDKYLLKK